MPPPAIAVIGCGAITQSLYVPALNSVRSRVGKIWFVDNNATQAVSTSRSVQNSEPASNYQTVLPFVSGAVIALPHHLHDRVSREFLSAGVHVLCEKPLTEDSTTARELVDLATSKNVTLSVNQTRRLMASSQKVKQLIDQRAIGELQSIEFNEGDEFNWPTASGFYFNPRISTRGVLSDIGSHVLDLLCWWLGEKPMLLASENDSFGGRESVAALRLKSRECTIDVRLSRLAGLSNKFLIQGTRGSIRGDIFDWRTVSMVAGGQERTLRLNSHAGTIAEAGHALLVNFVECVLGTRTPLVPAIEVIPTLELIDEAYGTAQQFSMPWYAPREIFHEA